jgi:hypothetical protein
MPRPADSALFATDATYAADGDTWAGDPVRVDPGTGRMDEGFEPDTLPAEWLNHVLGLHGDWLDYVASVIDEDDEHTYPNPGQRTVFTTGEAVPEDNGTSAPEWLGTNGVWVSRVAAAELSVKFRLPLGSALNEVRALVAQGGTEAGANRMSVQLFRHSVASFPTSAPTRTSIGALTYHNGSGSTNGGREKIGWTGLSESPDPSYSWYEVHVVSTQTGTTDVFYGLEIVFEDAGPRSQLGV